MWIEGKKDGEKMRRKGEGGGEKRLRIFTQEWGNVPLPHTAPKKGRSATKDGRGTRRGARLRPGVACSQRPGQRRRAAAPPPRALRTPSRF